MNLKDVLKIAEQLHQKKGGEIGLWPIFQIVRWTDERMGLGEIKREQEIRHLVAHARNETNLGGEPTLDALSFDAIPDRLSSLVITTERLITKARATSR